MAIDVKLLDTCPELSKYEKELIRRIDVNDETQSNIAKERRKTSSTISIQHKKALAKFKEWVEEREKQEKLPAEEEFDKQVFELFNKGWSPNKVVEKSGNLERVAELWKRYRAFLEDDYYTACKKITECGFEPNRSSKQPLSEQIGRIIEGRHWLAEEKKLVWKLLREKGYGPFTLGLREDDYLSTRDAVERDIDHLNEKIRALENLRRS